MTLTVFFMLNLSFVFKTGASALQFWHHWSQTSHALSCVMTKH